MSDSVGDLGALELIDLSVPLEDAAVSEPMPASIHCCLVAVSMGPRDRGDADMKVADVIQKAIGTLGENIKVRRFVRWELGEGV